MRVAYGYTQKWLLNNPLFDLQGLKGIGTADWATTANAARAVDWAAEVPSLDSVQCCDMYAGDDIIHNWDNQCHK